MDRSAENASVCFRVLAGRKLPSEIADVLIRCLRRIEQKSQCLSLVHDYHRFDLLVAPVQSPRFSRLLFDLNDHAFAVDTRVENE